MFSNSTSSSYCDWRAVPLKVRCSRKCATPDVPAVSYREPASMKTPTVAVSPWPPCARGREGGRAGVCVGGGEGVKGGRARAGGGPRRGAAEGRRRARTGPQRAAGGLPPRRRHPPRPRQARPAPRLTSLATRQPFFSVVISVAGAFAMPTGSGADAPRVATDASARARAPAVAAPCATTGSDRGGRGADEGEGQRDGEGGRRGARPRGPRRARRARALAAPRAPRRRACDTARGAGH